MANWTNLRVFIIFCCLLGVLFCLVQPSFLCSAEHPSTFGDRKIVTFYPWVYSVVIFLLVGAWNIYALRKLTQHYEDQAQASSPVNVFVWTEDAMMIMFSVPAVASLFDVTETWVIVNASLMMVVTFVFRVAAELKQNLAWAHIGVFMWIVMFVMVVSFEKNDFLKDKIIIGLMAVFLMVVNCMFFYLPYFTGLEMGPAKYPSLFGCLVSSFLYLCLALTVSPSCRA